MEWLGLEIIALLLLVGLFAFVWRTHLIARRAGYLEEVVEERTAQLQAEKSRVEEALAVAEREREVAREALATVEEQSIQLLRMDHTKARFFANISHELRTPLTLVLDTLESADRGDFGDLDEQLHHEVHRAALGGRRLLRLINDLLDLAQFEAGSVDLALAPGDFVGAVREVVQAFEPLAERSGISLHFSSKPDALPAAFDGEKVEHILFNLISNAIKATPEGGKVLVTVQDSATGGDDDHWVEVCVQDTGSGIAAESLPHIFDRFYLTGPSQVGRFGSTGIGLALTKELVELHGGTICVESVPEFGSKFIVELPLERVDAAPGPARRLTPVCRQYIQDALDQGPMPRRAQQTAAPGGAGAPEPEDGQRPLVLVVEDNAEVRALLRRHLGLRFRVVEATSGLEALAAARTTPPDLVVSDVVMPDLDGFGLVRRLRTDERLAEVPIILLTARATTEDRLQGLSLGADDYITKPFVGAELVARVENLIQSRRRLRERLSDRVLVEGRDVAVTSADAAFLERVYDAVNAHVASESFSVGVLATEVGVSESQLKRRLRTILDEAPVELIRRRRLERGAALLLGRMGTVSEVAMAVGFNSPSYFAKCFREHYGIAPSEYAERRDEPASVGDEPEEAGDGSGGSAAHAPNAPHA
jgi:signal transduction histidine kinase/DNA-binding response OmpR family regulator